MLSKNTTIAIRGELRLFLAIGTLSAAIYLLVAWCMTYMTNTLFISNLIAFLVALFFSYYFQSKKVFKKERTIENFLKFGVVQLGAFLIAFLLSVVTPLENKYLLSFFVSLYAAMISFAMNKFWTFVR